jgi:hypothetical protein
MFSLASVARAQASPTATRYNGLSVFGAASFIHPDYGQKVNYGFLLGADAHQHLHHIDLSIESRYDRAAGTVVNESIFTGGIKIERSLHSFHPYGDFEVGFGNIIFNHPVDPNYTHDNSFVWDFGGGLDHDITRTWAVKFDAQIQSWKLGSEYSRLTPYNVNVGLIYHIPFRGLRGRVQ